MKEKGVALVHISWPAANSSDDALCFVHDRAPSSRDKGPTDIFHHLLSPVDAQDMLQNLDAHRLCHLRMNAHRFRQIRFHERNVRQPFGLRSFPQDFETLTRSIDRHNPSAIRSKRSCDSPRSAAKVSENVGWLQS